MESCYSSLAVTVMSIPHSDDMGRICGRSKVACSINSLLKIEGPPLATYYDDKLTIGNDLLPYLELRGT